MTLRSRSTFFTRRTKRTTFSTGADAVALNVEVRARPSGDTLPPRAVVVRALGPKALLAAADAEPSAPADTLVTVDTPAPADAPPGAADMPMPADAPPGAADMPTPADEP